MDVYIIVCKILPRLRGVIDQGQAVGQGLTGRRNNGIGQRQPEGMVGNIAHTSPSNALCLVCIVAFDAHIVPVGDEETDACSVGPESGIYLIGVGCI